MPSVINSDNIPTNHIPANSVFISVGSKWARQTAGFGETTDKILETHKLNLANDLDKLKELDELGGKDLIDYANPGSSHGDILIELAAMPLDQRLEWAGNYLAEREAQAA